MTIINFLTGYFIFVNTKCVQGTRLLLVSSVNKLRINTNNRLHRINSESAKFEVRFSKIHVKSVI